VLDSPRCHGRVEVLAAIEDPEVIPRMLESMGLPSTEPARAPARLRKEGIDKSVIWYGENLQPQQWKWVRGEGGPMEWSRELQLAAKKDTKKLSEKAIDCQRMEGKLVTRDRQFNLVEWWSDDVPGGIVGAELFLGDGPGSAKNVLEAIAMGVSDPAEEPPKPPGK
jgi:hypothetical protein